MEVELTRGEKVFLILYSRLLKLKDKGKVDMVNANPITPDGLEKLQEAIDEGIDPTYDEMVEFTDFCTIKFRLKPTWSRN